MSFPRFAIATLIFAFLPVAFSQTKPSFQWIKEVDGSGTDSFAGLGVDRQGNTYLAGSTYSATFPIKSAVQNHLASAGLYRVDGPGSDYVPLGLTTASYVVVDPQSPNTLYVISNQALLRSSDGGVTFSKLSIPSSSVQSFAINPSNDKILYAGTFDQGLFKSSDGGASWAASNGSLHALSPGQFFWQEIWVDPTSPNVLLGNSQGNFVRSADSGATWQQIGADPDILSVAFDTANPGVVYAVTNLGAASKSTDQGQNFTSLNTPANFQTILSDPTHSGRLFAAGQAGIYESDDGGATWKAPLNLGFVVNGNVFVADWANEFLYTGNQSVVRITTDLQTVTQVGPPSVGYLGSIAAANGHAYIAVQGTRDVFVTKLDPSGNIVYSTYFGGTNDDVATAMAVDPSGNVYVTGTTSSADFPVTKGSYASTGFSFLFKLNPDGSVAYSSYFAPSGNTPAQIAIDSAGSAYIAGSSLGNLPVTPGAYQTNCNCGVVSTGFSLPSPQEVTNKLAIITDSGFLSKFDVAGAKLVYSTYIAGSIAFVSVVNTLAIGSDGTAYVGGQNGVFHLNAAGSALLGTLAISVNASALAVGPDGNVYLAGVPFASTTNQFQPTAGAFQTSLSPAPQLPDQSGFNPGTAVAKLDPQLTHVIAATYLGAVATPRDIAFDSSGNVYLGGSTPPQGLPTRTPLQAGFANGTGFVSELSADFSTLLFSSYFGDTENFSVGSLAVSPDGSVILGGVTGQANNSVAPASVWVNSLTLAPPPALRIDSVVNAASLSDGPISAGETINVRGAGFGSTPQLVIGGVGVPAISATATSITAVVPSSVSLGGVFVQVQAGGGSSNQVMVPVNAASPGLFSQDGSGFGQGYILNKNGTLNTPSNPAAPGDPITIFATGVGPVSFTQGYAVTQFPVNVYVDGLFCNGLAAVMGPVQGFPGSVYQITVYIPNPPALVSANPNFANFSFPPLDAVVMTINGATSQIGLAISIAQ